MSLRVLVLAQRTTLGAENSKVVTKARAKCHTHTFSLTPDICPAVPQQSKTATVQVQSVHDKEAKRPTRTQTTRALLTETSEQLQPSASLTVQYGEQMEACPDILNEDSSENAKVRSAEVLKTQNKCPANRPKYR